MSNNNNWAFLKKNTSRLIRSGNDIGAPSSSSASSSPSPSSIKNSNTYYSTSAGSLGYFGTDASFNSKKRIENIIGSARASPKSRCVSGGGVVCACVGGRMGEVGCVSMLVCVAHADITLLVLPCMHVLSLIMHYRLKLIYSYNDNIILI